MIVDDRSSDTVVGICFHARLLPERPPEKRSSPAKARR
jgi:hypothetical protein